MWCPWVFSSTVRGCQGQKRGVEVGVTPGGGSGSVTMDWQRLESPGMLATVSFACSPGRRGKKEGGEGDERRGGCWLSTESWGEVRGSLTKSPHQLWDFGQVFSMLTRF